MTDNKPDIVGRLRKATGTVWVQEMQEAADEIELLREKIGAARAVLPRRKNPDSSLQKLVNLAAGLLDDD